MREKYKLESQSSEKRVTISFLDRDDSSDLIDLGQSIDFNFYNFGQMTSQNSRVGLNLISLFALSPIIASTILDHRKQNFSIVIKNNELKSFFSILFEFEEFENIPEVKVFSLWEFPAHNVYQNRETWCDINQLQLHNCCLRNFLMEPSNLDFKYLNEIHEISSAPEKSYLFLDKHCKFPDFFVNVEPTYSTRIHTPEDLPKNILDEITKLKFNPVMNYKKILMNTFLFFLFLSFLKLLRSGRILAYDYRNEIVYDLCGLMIYIIMMMKEAVIFIKITLVFNRN